MSIGATNFGWESFTPQIERFKKIAEDDVAMRLNFDDCDEKENVAPLTAALASAATSRVALSLLSSGPKDQLEMKSNREASGKENVLNRFNRSNRKSMSPTRSPQIYTLPDEAGIKRTYISIGREEFQIRKFGSGKDHDVFEFLQSGIKEIGGVPINLQNALLKVVARKNVVRIAQAHEEDLKGYDQLVQYGVPVVESFIRPDLFNDPENERNGNFWIVRRLTTSVSVDAWRTCSDEEALKNFKPLAFAKAWLRRAAEVYIKERIELINDFYPRNVMADAAGNLQIVDFAAPQNDDVMENLYSYLKAWSNCNQNVWNFLVSSFPDSVKQSMETKLAVEKARNNGLFPVSRNS